MTGETDDLDRLLELLRADPARHAQLRLLLVDEQVERPSGIVERLAQAQLRTEERLESLNARVDALGRAAPAAGVWQVTGRHVVAPGGQAA